MGRLGSVGNLFESLPLPGFQFEGARDFAGAQNADLLKSSKCFRGCMKSHPFYVLAVNSALLQLWDTWVSAGLTCPFRAAKAAGVPKPSLFSPQSPVSVISRGVFCPTAVLLSLPVDFSPPARSSGESCGLSQWGKFNDSRFHRKQRNFQSHSNCPFQSFKPSVTKRLTLSDHLSMLVAGPPTHPT